MTVTIIFKRTAKQKPRVIDDVVSIVENSSTIGIGTLRVPTYYPRALVKKMKVRL